MTNAVGQATGNGGAPASVAPSSTQVAGDICADLRTALGRSFASQFGSLERCGAKLGASAICTSLTKKLGAASFARKHGSFGHCQSSLKQKQQGRS